MPLRALLLTLVLIAASTAAESPRTELIAHCIAHAGPDHPPVELTLFGQVMTGTVPVAGDSDGCELKASGRSMRVPWKVIGDEQLLLLAEPTILDGDVTAQRAFLAALGPDARKHPLHLRLTEALIAADPEAFAAQRREQVAAREQAAAEPADAEPAQDAMAAGDDAESTDAAEAPAPGSAKDWDAQLFTKRGELKASAYARYNLALDAKSTDHRLGPDGVFFGTDDREDPEVHQPHADGAYRYKERKTPVTDYTGLGGQVGYVPLQGGDPGLGRIRFVWTKHEGHGGAKYWHEYLLAPTYDEWWAKPVDPGLQQGEWAASAGGSLPRPVAIGRSVVSWSNCGILAFGNGLIGASGYGNNGDKYPCTRLPAGDIPSAVAVSPNNEFAFVTTWGKDQVGRLYVIALESRTLAHHSSPYAALPNVAGYTRLKVLGSVELPFACPTGVAATTDAALWKWASPLSKESLDDAKIRAKWRESADEHHTYASRGFAVVVSRSESKACVVDLSPLYKAFAKAYFHDYDAARVTNEGPRPEQWPPTFAVMTDAVPRVGKAIRVPQPTAVACGFADPASMADAVFIGTMAGKLLVMRPNEGGLKPVASLDVGRNACAIDLGRNMHYGSKDRIIVVSRGDRQVVVIEDAGSAHARIGQVIRDARLRDPVDVQGWESRGSCGLTVADFKGKQLINYLIEPISAWGDALYPGFAGDTGLDYERTGILPIAGAPYIVTGAEVN